MKKTSLYIDEARLKAVGALLGTVSSTDTVNRALAELEAQDKRRQLVERMRTLSEKPMLGPLRRLGPSKPAMRELICVLPVRELLHLGVQTRTSVEEPSADRF